MTPLTPEQMTQLRKRTELAQRLANPKYNDCINLETDTILALLDLAQGGGWRPPEGWKLVPEEPTDEMYRAALTVTRDAGYGHCHDATGGGVYRAMLFAAPPAPGATDGGGK